MITEILKCLLSAYRGKKHWRKLKRAYKICNEDCLVLMPHNDLSLNNCACVHLIDYMKRKYIKRAFVITVNEGLCENNLLQDKVTIAVANESVILDICQYYRLIQFMKYITVISFEAPYGSKGLITKGGYLVDDMIRASIFGY